MAVVWGRCFRRIFPFLRGWTFRPSSNNEQSFRILIPLCSSRAYQVTKAFRTSCVLDDNSFKTYTDAYWRKKLSPEQYQVCRAKGTEPPWSGELLHNKQSGIYSCVCCDADLFNSSTKFDSESGWPSFWSAIEREQTDEQKKLDLPNLSVDQVLDKSHGMVRVEVLCSQEVYDLGLFTALQCSKMNYIISCGSHLGHVFSDGPKPTGLRYCINSIALKFTPTVAD